ncbi:tetratricopeptide repeat domain 27 [Strigomonas culicis]|uniref:Tetratricopeptide repeat domain 27 n=1 Tax=Strigomonas culicis TaxID=28005 RepID=S9V519_9TRYP|nr:tetratricopeptide repeat domain 27 [Strigomonas culicis]|eukprot:EPY22011.1 tetratricopeptide repeat domain 27 [Strigomonas culicis]
MSVVIPELLLRIPAPEVDFKFIEDSKKLQLTVPQAEQLSQAYCRTVASFLRAHEAQYTLRTHIVPAVEFGLQLFNAENVTGELTAGERESYRVLYERFSEEELLVVKRQPAAVVDKQKEAEEEARGVVENLKMAYLQRLLTRDGEMVSPCVRFSALLLCLVAIVSASQSGAASADGVTTDMADPKEDAAPVVPLCSLWRLRVHFRHQRCLLHRSHALFLHLSACVDALLQLPEEEVTVEALLEVAQVQGYYHRRELATATVHTAMQRSGLQLEETAMMGVRTRWQQHQLVQSILNARSSREVPPASMGEEQPKMIMSEKDGHDLLDMPRAMPDAAPVALSPLHPEDKAIILALCSDIANQNPHHGLTSHHMQFYVERLVADPAPAPFVVAAQTLLIRSRLEQRRNRTQERSFMQMTELMDQYSGLRDPTHAMLPRAQSPYFYSVSFPSIWSLKAEFASFCFEETLFKTALDIYEQILDWENIIECCKKLDKRRRAETLARDLLEKDPTNPMLWVALGEATREDRYLWKAWELCEHRMAAPMRALARLALDREQYEKVVQYFDLAVAVNPVFGGDWFSLGYAALRLQQWQRSGEAFTRACQIDPADAFAWNNLASIFIRENKLRPAFNSMSQALRNNRRDWRMWQNYFQIGCQLKEVLECTHALSTCLDIAKRQMVLDPTAMEQFVDLTLAYLKGSIPGSAMEATTADEGQRSVTFTSMTATAMAADESAIEHLPLEEGDDETVADLAPFGADVEMPERFFDKSEEQNKAQERAEVTKASIRQRHEERVRALFQRLMDTYVSDPDLYHSTAVLFGALDGPLRRLPLPLEGAARVSAEGPVGA